MAVKGVGATIEPWSTPWPVFDTSTTRDADAPMGTVEKSIEAGVTRRMGAPSPPDRSLFRVGRSKGKRSFATRGSVRPFSRKSITRAWNGRPP